MYTVLLTLRAAQLLGLFATSWLYAAARDHVVCPILFFTNATSYNVVVGQRVDATTYYDREKVSRVEPLVWQVAPAGASIPLGRLNREQFMIDLIYKFYGVHFGSDKRFPITFNIDELHKPLYNVVLCQRRLLLSHAYTTELSYEISPRMCLQDIFARARRCLPYGISGGLESMDDLHKIGSAFVDAAKDPAYAYLFLNLPKIDDKNKTSTAAVLTVIKYLWSDALDSDSWLASARNDKDVALPMGRSLNYHDWLGMHAQTIFGQAYTTVDAQCRQVDQV